MINHTYVIYIWLSCTLHTKRHTHIVKYKQNSSSRLFPGSFLSLVFQKYILPVYVLLPEALLKQPSHNAWENIIVFFRISCCSPRRWFPENIFTIPYYQCQHMWSGRRGHKARWKRQRINQYVPDSFLVFPRPSVMKHGNALCCENGRKCFKMNVWLPIHHKKGLGASQRRRGECNVMCYKK